ncbi:MAG TPA: PDZ domain-containing protein [Polyangiales bacterium]|nr:PDZ domain-containing protein [Polyangiales bacterium]
MRPFDGKTFVADAPLELTGEGLPAGAPIEIALRGTMHAAGLADAPIDLALSGWVLSPERLTAASQPSIAAQLGRGSFSGALAIRCLPPALCAGSLENVRFDVDGPSAIPLSRLRTNASALLASLGIELADDSSRAHGLTIARVEPNGTGARAGLQAGDVIETRDGVRLHALSDMAPPPSAASVTLQLKSASGRRRIELPLMAASPFADAHRTASYLLACSILWLLFWLTRWPTPGQLATRALGALGTRTARGRHVWFLPCLFAAGAAIGSESIDIFALLLLHLTFVLMQWRRSTPLWPRLGELALLWLGVGAVAAISGMRNLAGLIRDQGAMPWEWNWFARPPLLLAGALCLIAASRMPSKTLLDNVARGLVALLVSALFFGGSRTNLVGLRESIAVGSALAAAKSMLVFGALSFPIRIRAKLMTRCALALLPLTAAWIWFSPSRNLELSIGGATFMISATGLALALIEHRWTRRVTELEMPLV